MGDIDTYLDSAAIFRQMLASCLNSDSMLFLLVPTDGTEAMQTVDHAKKCPKLILIQQIDRFLPPSSLSSSREAVCYYILLMQLG